MILFVKPGSLLDVHKNQLQLSINFKDIDVVQFSKAMLVSVCLLAIHKHSIILATAGDFDLNHTKLTVRSCLKQTPTLNS